MYFTKTKRSYFRFASPTTPESPGHNRTASNNSSPPGRRAGLVPVVAQGVLTNLIEPYINDIFKKIRGLFPCLVQTVYLLLEVVFGSY